LKTRKILASFRDGYADRCICALTVVVIVLVTGWLLATQMFAGRFG
jgi:hypothetical protein